MISNKKSLFTVIISTVLLFHNCEDYITSGSSLKRSGIAYMYYDNSIECHLELIDETGNNKRRLLSRGSIIDFEWFNSGKKIVYTYISGDSSFLSIYNLNENINKTIFTSTTDEIGEVDISDDQSTIVFLLKDTASQRKLIAVINTSGTEFRKITDGGHTPMFSPNNASIYFSYKNQIHSINKDGSNLRQITPDDPNAAIQFDISPDGSELIYTRFGGANDLFITDALGKEHQIIINIDSIAVSGGDYIAEPKFSPNGTTIYFGHKSKLISFYDLSTKNIRHIYFGPSNIYNIWWIPGKEKIVYTTNEDFNFNILTIGNDGENKKQLLVIDSGYWIMKVSPKEVAF